MATIHDRMENPTLGYVVIAVALAAGMLAASALGQSPKHGKTHDHGKETRLVPNSDLIQPTRRWVLGVRADATDTGYLIRHVEHSSAARQFGLEVGDRIVTINGTQIGRLGHQVVRLGDQLEKHGGHHGSVLLLIQNRRNSRLVPLRVTLRHPTEHLGH